MSIYIYISKKKNITVYKCSTNRKRQRTYSTLLDARFLTNTFCITFGHGKNIHLALITNTFLIIITNDDHEQSKCN